MSRIITLILIVFSCGCVSQRNLTEYEEDLRYEEYWRSIEEHIIYIENEN